MLFLFVLAGTASVRPPPITAVQQRLLTAAPPKAKACSDAAHPTLLKYFDTAAFRKNISSLSISKEPAASIYSWFIGNLAALPLITNFNFTHWAYIEQSTYLPNKWELQVAQIVHGTGVEDKAERVLYEFPPFPIPLTPTLDEAYNRPNYVALNIWEKADGNTRYGETQFVIRPSWQAYMMFAPMDTGRYVEECMASGDNSSSSLQPGIESGSGSGSGSGGRSRIGYDCSAWKSHCIGTHGFVDHLVLEHQTFYEYGLYEIFKRMDGKVDAIKFNWYWEAVLLHALFIPEAILYSVASFRLLWGTPNGKAFETWHVSNARALAWAEDVDGLLLDVFVTSQLPTQVIIHGHTASTTEVNTWNTAWTSIHSWSTLRNATALNYHLHYMMGTELTSTCPNQCPSPGKCEYMGVNSKAQCVMAIYPN